MKPINTRVATYDIFGHEGGTELVEDGTGDYVYVEDHFEVVAALQARIKYLEACYGDALVELLRA